METFSSQSMIISGKFYLEKNISCNDTSVMQLTSGCQSNVGVNMPAHVLKVERPNKWESMKNWLQEVRGYNTGQTPV